MSYHSLAWYFFSERASYHIIFPFQICQILGLAGIDLFTPSDVVEKRNVRKVCMCIRSLSKKAGTMHLNVSARFECNLFKQSFQITYGCPIQAVISKQAFLLAWCQVPDFDIVTRTIAMPNYIVGGIRRSLEQPQRSSSCSSGHSPRASSDVLHLLANSLNTISLTFFACLHCLIMCLTSILFLSPPFSTEHIWRTERWHSVWLWWSREQYLSARTSELCCWRRSFWGFAISKCPQGRTWRLWR